MVSCFEDNEQKKQSKALVKKSSSLKLLFSIVHSTGAIQVEIPRDPTRYNFISAVAEFVANDGSMLEKRLIESENGNPLFNFLTLENASPEQHVEHIFYRWRVFSFCQGDTFSSWRTEPFTMFHPHGRYYIPPPVDKEAAIREQDNWRERDRLSQSLRNERKQAHGTESSRRGYVTGRQLEIARSARRKGGRKHTDGRGKLSAEALDEFDTLINRNLSLSRESICRAMAFCFEKSAAAKEISSLLKKAIEDEHPSVTLDMKIARLYLLSDVLFNSQQTGVKNAFIYRTQIEKMAPDIFFCLGKTRDRAGRITMNKLRKAVSTVLGAWTDWSVYDPAFIDDLDARFQGQEIKPAEVPPNVAMDLQIPMRNDNEDYVQNSENLQHTTTAPHTYGNWKQVDENLHSKNEDPGTGDQPGGETISDIDGVQGDLSTRSKCPPADNNVLDGDPVDEEEIDRETNHECIDNDLRIGSGDHGFEAVAGSDDVDGQALIEGDIDGELVHGEDLDGEYLEGEDLDGDPL